MGKNFIRVRSIKDIVVFTTLILVGILLTTLPDAVGANLGGYMLIALGLLLAIVLKTSYRDVATQEIYSKKEFSFLGEMKEPILSALASSNPEAIALSEDGKGQVLKLHLYYSRKTGKAYLQLFEYIPHEYEPCSAQCEFNIGSVAKLLK